MKRILCILLATLLLVGLVGCGKEEGEDMTTEAPAAEAPTARPPATEAPIVRTNYVYEDGFGGAFVISLYDDGTFLYTEGPLSSYLGMGTWRMTDGIVTLKTNDEYARVHSFERRPEGLIYLRRDGEPPFLYLDLPEGTVFEVREEE